MRTRRFALIAACTALALAGCVGAGAPETESSGAPVAVESEAPEAPEAPEVAAETPASEGYLDDNGAKDVTSHMACVQWSEQTDDTGLTGDQAMSVAGRAIRSDDPNMAGLVTEAGIGPMITDPWGMTELCINHGYDYEDGSLASEHYNETLMG